MAKLTKKIRATIIAMNMSEAGKRFDRKAIIEVLVNKLGMSPKGAATYCANIKKAIEGAEVLCDRPEPGFERFATSPSPIYVIDGIWFNSIGRVLMEDVYVRNANTHQFSETQRLAYDFYIDYTLGDYRERMKNYTPSNEERFEMRAAFGEGTKVVNVLTGQTFEV